MTKMSIRSKIQRLRPDLVLSIKGNEFKRKLALALRSLRKKKGMTQKDIVQNSTLSQSAISRLEAPSGPLPTFDAIMRYVKACSGHMQIGFSAHEEFDAAAFVAAHADDGEMTFISVV